jgi:uncharacterized protein
VIVARAVVAGVADVVEVEVVGAEDAVVVGAENMQTVKDRVGLGWRPELAGGIFNRLDQIDLVEVIADDFFDAPAREVRALKTLASQLPVVFHGVGMGLASAGPVEEIRLARMACLVDQVRPQLWSEHLAFVRAGDVEIGHLAAPPRTRETVEGTVENLRRASAIVGSRPWMENIATLIDPPASTMSEISWINSILALSGCNLLLDLHNVLANSINHGFDAMNFLREIPVERLGIIHIAGGQMVPAPDGGQRLLDDHLHDVPDPVFDLLEETAALAPAPLTVILERDGDYPSMNSLLLQTERARQAMARGRARRTAQIEILV